ncbi:hypothetical protein CVT25_002766 [Psilocybe cyanescens]|uniref:Uncharacterized protein n=1 Tax=Psilocybe cyanescens TaxID=93625 RepID=A0A409XC35_PSICY|nr:hypothetical protein CVT25_002766 [Psilocybe cyanescens]
MAPFVTNIMQPPVKKSFTLKSFLQKYQQIGQQEDDGDEYKPDPGRLADRFALTGSFTSSNEHKKAEINTFRDRLLNNTDGIHMRRDFDSVIGLANKIPMRASCNYYPLPNTARRLMKRVHFKHPFRIPRAYQIPRNTPRDEWPEVQRDPSTVPNMVFGVFDIRHTVRLFFPGLINLNNDTGDSGMTQDQMAEFYNKIIRETVSEVMWDCSHDWPASYAAAQARDRNHAQGFAQNSVLIPDDVIEHFAEEMRRVVDASDLDWAQHYVWGVEVRGVKHGNNHLLDCTDEEIRAVEQRALDCLVYDFYDSTQSWWVDVGLEISKAGRALLWSTDGHSALMQHSLGIDERTANRIICNQRKYTRHLSSHLTCVSGFSAKLGNEGVGHHGAIYMQAYTTDKSQTYNPQNGHYGKTLTTKLAVKGNPPSWCTAMEKIYKDAGSVIDVVARVEIRVPFSNVRHALLGYRTDLFERTLICYPRSIWWDFRVMRLNAATQILSAISVESAQYRNRQNTLALIAGLVWLINGLHSAPDNSQHWRAVQKAVLPLTLDNNTVPNAILPQGDTVDTNNEDNVPFAEYNVVYLRDFFYKEEADSLRFRGTSELPEAAFRYIFGCPPWEYAISVLGVSLPHQPRPRGYIAARKGNTRHRPSATVLHAQPDPDFEQFEDVVVVHEEPEWGPDVEQQEPPLLPMGNNTASERGSPRVHGLVHFGTMAYYVKYLHLINNVDPITSSRIRQSLYNKIGKGDGLQWKKGDGFTAIPYATESGPKIFLNPWYAGIPTMRRLLDNDDLIDMREEEEERTSEM